MESAGRHQAPSLGRAIDLLFLELIEAKASYEDFKREFLKLEKQWMPRARTPKQRLAVRQTIAKTLLTEAYGSGLPGKEFSLWFRRLQRLGFRDLGMRVHVTCLYVQALHLFPRRAREAWAMLDDTQRRVRRLRRENPLREEHLEAIAHARRTARIAPPS